MATNGTARERASTATGSGRSRRKGLRAAEKPGPGDRAAVRFMEIINTVGRCSTVLDRLADEDESARLGLSGAQRAGLQNATQELAQVMTDATVKYIAELLPDGI